MPREIPKAYEPQQIEQRWAQAWVEQQLFRAEASADGSVFSIVIPPPNVDRKSTRLNSSHIQKSRMPSSA